MKTARTYFADEGEANGRCYDPMMSSFLSVDAYLQDPTSAQGFNRYAYCAYNPLRYTDPTGWSMRYGSEIDPPRNPDDPPGYTWTGEDNNVIDYSKDDSLPEITINSNGTWSIPSVPDGHSGTPASQSGPYYQPAPNPGNGSSNGHGTGGNIGGNGHGNSTKAISSYGLTLIGTYTSIQKGNWQNPATRSQKQLNQKRAYEIQKELKQQGVQKYVKDIKADRISKFKTAGYELAVVSLILEGSDVYVCKEIKTSNLVNVGMVIVGLSCWEVALAYAAIDIGSSLITGKSFGEHLDNWIGHPVYKWGD